ncbi:unnamed protein product [Pylaiella littoralis]
MIKEIAALVVFNEYTVWACYPFWAFRGNWATESGNVFFFCFSPVYSDAGIINTCVRVCVCVCV